MSMADYGLWGRVTTVWRWHLFCVGLVGTFKAGVRHCMVACPDGCWWDAMPDIAGRICQLPSWSAGLSPFLLQYKQFLELASAEGLLVDVKEDVNWDQVVHQFDQTLVYW